MKCILLVLTFIASITLSAQDCESLVHLKTKGSEVYLESSIYISSLKDSIDLTMDGSKLTIDFIEDLGFHNYKDLVEVFCGRYTGVTEYNTDNNILSIVIPMQSEGFMSQKLFKDYTISKVVFFRLPVEDMEIVFTSLESEKLSQIISCMYYMTEELKKKR